MVCIAIATQPDIGYSLRKYSYDEVIGILISLLGLPFTVLNHHYLIKLFFDASNKSKVGIPAKRYTCA